MGAFDGYALLPEQGAEPQKQQLSREMQSALEQTASRLNVSDASAVMGFGARAQSEMDTFSSMALQQMLREDTAPLDKTLNRLSLQIKSCAFGGTPQGMFARMLGKASSYDQVRAAYQKAIPEIDRCADEMTDSRVGLTRDSAMLQRLYDKNEKLYKELCSLLIVGEEALAQSRKKGMGEYEIQRLERRLQDIRVTKLASTQLAVQLKTIQESDRLACERLQAALEVTIPLWKAQMAAALGLARANDTLSMNSKFNRTAASGIRGAANEMNRQSRALASGADREAAAQTADKLLAELHDISMSLSQRREGR